MTTHAHDEAIPQAFTTADDVARGRLAASPWSMPAHGWGDIVWRTYRSALDDRLLMVAAAITFYGVLALVPALAAIVSIYGLMFDASAVPQQVEMFRNIVPEATLSIIQGQLERLAQQTSSGLSLTLFASLAVAIWSANAGTRALIDGLNIVYGEEEQRSTAWLIAVSLAMTVLGLVGAVVLVAVVIAVPAIVAFVPLETPPWVVTAASFGLLAVVAMLAVGVLYRVGPNRHRANWAWITPGAVLAVALIVLVSYGFSVYAKNFGSYDVTYGSLGGLIAFLTWVWITMAALLTGAELDAEIEHQTVRDTTTGKPRPLGKRGAMVADTVGVTRDSGLPVGADAATARGIALRKRQRQRQAQTVILIGVLAAAALVALVDRDVVRDA